MATETTPTVTFCPEWVSGNIFIRPNRGPAGATIAGHAHRFDHTTIFFVGRFRVTAQPPGEPPVTQEFTAPSHCLIRAGVTHEITFLEAGEFWCVYSHQAPQGRISQVHTGWGDPYR